MTNLFSKFKSFFKIEFVKTSSLIGGANILAMVTGLIVNKILALKLGPSGFAYIGQFRSFVTISSNIATGGIKDAVIKYVSEFKEDDNILNLVLKTAFTITFISGILTGVVIILFAKYWTILIFSSPIHVFIIRLFGVSIVFFALNTFCLSVINGLKKIKLLTKLQILGSLISLVLTGGLCYFYNLKGALIALSLLQSLQFGFTIYFISKLDVFKLWKRSLNLDKFFFKKFLGYASLSFFTAFIAPMVEFAIRDYIINAGMPDKAGIWDAMLKLSRTYMAVIGATLPVYFLPKFSAIKQSKEILTEILSTFKIIIPIALIGFAIMYFGRDIIIRILFSSSFSGMSHLFFPQIISNFFQLISLVLIQLVIAKAMIKKMIFIQIFFSIFSYVLSIEMFKHYDIIGIVYGNSIRYFLFVCVLLFICRNLLFNKAKAV
jgi:O-antigen/teichoic acid export membrane protein